MCYFAKKENLLVLSLVLFLGSGMARQATVCLEGMQGASSAMCVPVDIFQTLSCETIPRKGEKKNTQMEICPLCIQKLAACNVLRGQF